MDPVLPLGFILVGVALLTQLVLVLAGRRITEKMHRDRQKRGRADG